VPNLAAKDILLEESFANSLSFKDEKDIGVLRLPDDFRLIKRKRGDLSPIIGGGDYEPSSMLRTL
jgi:hypothetical protein